jgi:hypothetical protein
VSTVHMDDRPAVAVRLGRGMASEGGHGLLWSWRVVCTQFFILLSSPET